MKLKLSKGTLGFIFAGLVFALVQVALSVSYWLSDSPVTKQHMSELAASLYFTCPFALGEIAMDSDRIQSHWAIFYIIMIVQNVVLYFLLGLACSYVVRMIKRWLEPRAKLQS